MLPRGNVQRDFIDRCESPARCATDCGIVSVGLPLHRQAPLQGVPLPRPPRRGFCLGAPAPSAGSLRVGLWRSARRSKARLSRRCGAPMLGERVGLILLIVADHSTTVVVDPAAAETHLTTSRRQWPAANRAALDLSVRSPKSVCFLARRHSADLCGSRTCEAAQQAQN